MTAREEEKPKTANARLAAKLVALVAVMVSLSFAAVPFYDWFCRVTGYAGTPGVAASGSGRILDRTIRVRFDANVEAGMPWKFRPVDKSMVLRIGETGLAFYEAYNPTGRRIGGTASFNVTPDAAGYFFTKIDCFCFTEQVLEPGQRVEMPVSFYIDPEMVTDRDGRYVREITLSYTFHEAPLPESRADLSLPGKAAATGTVN